MSGAKVGKGTLTVTAICVAVAAFAVAAFGPPILRRQHQEEALRELTRLARVAAVYYVKPRADAEGNRPPCSFPLGDIRTSLAKSCWDPQVGNGEGLCDPAKIEWNRSLWVALKWRLTEPHAWIYAYESHGTMADARFAVSAYGDLDGDGVFSTFRYTGKGSAQSTATDCILTDSPAFEAVAPAE
jgi:hypothetical protein